MVCRSPAGNAREMSLGDRVGRPIYMLGGSLCFSSMRSHIEVGRNFGMREKVENYGWDVWQGNGIGCGR